MRRRPALPVRLASPSERVRPLLLALLAWLPLWACASPDRAAAPPAAPQVGGAPAEPGQDELGAMQPDAEAAAAEQQPEPGEDAGATGEPGTDPSIHGYLNARTRSRWDDEGDDDHNLYLVGAVDMETGGENPWSFHLMGRGQWQLDGPSDDSVFFGIEDTYDSAVTGRLYYFYVDAPEHETLRLARLGRQRIVETPVFLHFDGLLLETQALGLPALVLGAYTGFPVRLWRDEYTDELMGGVYASLRPWRTGELRFDYSHLVDDPRFGQDENDLMSFALRQEVGRNLRLEGTYGLLDGESRDLRLAANWIVPEEQLSIRYAFYDLFEPQTDLVNELNPFFDSLRTWFPFVQNKLSASKVFGEWFQLQLGMDFRRVSDGDDVGEFNRDFDRYYLTATLLDKLPGNTSLGLTGEIWDSDGNDINSWGLDLTSRWTESVRTSIGTFYSLYKYYLDIDEERTDVRTYYVEFRDRIGEPTDIMVRYDFEDDELFYYHTLRLGITWKF